MRLAFLSGFQFFFGINDELSVSEHKAQVMFTECMQNTAFVACMLSISIPVHCQSEGI